MAQLTLRSTRDSALTWEEGDANLLALDSDSPWKVSENHITYDGKVGIAVDSTYSPVYDLDFGNGDSATVGITNGDLVVHVDGPNQFKLWNNTVQSITVKTTGKVGINDSDPSEMLTVGGNLRVSDTALANVVSANSMTDGVMSISTGQMTNVKRLAVADENVEIQFGSLYDKSTGYRVSTIDSFVWDNSSGFPTTAAVYEKITTEIDLLGDSFNNLIDIINGKLDSVDGNLNLLQNNIDSVNNSLITHITDINTKFDSVNVNLNSIQNEVNNISDGNVILAKSFTVQGTSFNGSVDQTVTFTGSTGIDVTGTTITNTAPDQTVSFTNGTGISVTGTYPAFTVTNTSPDQTVSLTGSGATSISGTYPNFTISSTDTNTTYTAGTGLTLSGTQFINSAPDQTVSLTGSGATSISGTYPNFTISSTNTNTTYSAGSGITLSGTTFSNAAPDQTVTLTGAGGLTVSGSYPNFTLTQGAVSGYTLPLAASGTRGGVQVGYSTNAKNYAVALSGEKMYVNVPWTDTNTTYTAGNGLTLSGTQFTMSGSYTGTLTCTGDVVAFSDVALKSNINPITEALERVSQIGGYTYNKVGEDHKRTGVLAQEIQEVLPEAVHTNEDGVLGVAYGNLTGLLIEAVKELSAKVKELESKIGV